MEETLPSFPMRSKAGEQNAPRVAMSHIFSSCPSSHKMFAFEVVFRSVFTQEKKFSEKNEKLCEKFLFSV